MIYSGVVQKQQADQCTSPVKKTHLGDPFIEEKASITNLVEVYRNGAGMTYKVLCATGLIHYCTTLH